MNAFTRVSLRFLGAWRLSLGLLLAAGIVAFLLFFRLGTLTPGLSQPEVDTIHQSQTLKTILKNPVNGPYKIVEFGVIYFWKATPWHVRLISAGFGTLALLMFYLVLRRWHANRIALLGTVLFGTSSWFLHSARLATPDIMLALGLLTLIFYGMRVLRTSYAGWAIPVGLILGALLLYIPGMIWLLVPGAIWWHKPLARKLKNTSEPVQAVATIVALGLLAPLGWAIYKQPDLIKTILGMPAAVPHIPTFLQTLIHVPLQLFVRGPVTPLMWLGHAPILDFFASVMLLLGAYVYFLQFELDRTRLLAGALIVSGLLIALGGPVTFSLLLPCIYIVVTSGIELMLQQWFTVFPRNPLARGLGVWLLGAAITVACLYNLGSYFVAWPHTPATKQTFSRHT